MTAISISLESAASGGQLSERIARLLRRVSASMRFRNYPAQRRLRAKAAMRWLAHYTRHQH